MEFAQRPQPPAIDPGEDPAGTREQERRNALAEVLVEALLDQDRDLVAAVDDPGLERGRSEFLPTRTTVAPNRWASSWSRFASDASSASMFFRILTMSRSESRRAIRSKAVGRTWWASET